MEETRSGLTKQMHPPDEILVVEDIDRLGPGWARNKGIEKARGNLIAFIDDDCIPNDDWLERFIGAIEKHDAAMVSSHYLETDPFLHEVRQRRKFPTTVQVNPGGFVGTGGNVIFKRQCLDECLREDGFIFNPVFGHFASEDIELIWRLRRRGHKLVFIPNEVKHVKKMTPIKYVRHQFIRGIGIGFLYQLKRKAGGNISPDRSLLWGEDARKHSALKWLVIIWKKLLGPFDYRSFSDSKHFLTFWVGEKLQSLGFLLCIIFKRIV